MREISRFCSDNELISSLREATVNHQWATPLLALAADRIEALSKLNPYKCHRFGASECAIDHPIMACDRVGEISSPEQCAHWRRVAG